MSYHHFNCPNRHCWFGFFISLFNSKKHGMSEQYLLNFPKERKRKQNLNRRRVLRLGVLQWLFTADVPDAVAFDVPTRPVGLKADLIASWHSPQRHKKLRMSLLVPQRVMLVLCMESRAECWPECANPEEILAEIARLRTEMQHAEKEIRSSEPDLLDNNMLFEEFAVWNYGKSKNLDYQQLRSRMKSLENNLYKGTKLEKIARLGLADELYLAVPENELHPQELIAGWGLLSVGKDLQVKVLQKSAERQVLPEMRMHIVQQMLCTGRNALLESQGFQIMNDGSCRFVKRPRCRKLPAPPEL
jgi:hypothetical protein